MSKVCRCVQQEDKENVNVEMAEKASFYESELFENLD